MGNEHRRRWGVSWFEDDVHSRHTGSASRVTERVQRYGKRLTVRRERREAAAEVERRAREQT